MSDKRKFPAMLVLSVMAIVAALASPVAASASTTGSSPPVAPLDAVTYMLVNDFYDTPMMCLSTNSTPPPGQTGTHQVYLAPCNSTVITQWWYLPPPVEIGVPASPDQVMNQQKSSNGTEWCLSTNRSTPPGGVAGTHAVYAAGCGAGTLEHFWYNVPYRDIYSLKLKSVVRADNKDWCVSTSKANPLPGGTTYPVYASQCSTAAAQIWRPYHP